MNSVYQITNKCFGRKLNVLCCPIHERYAQSWAGVNATFWMGHVPNGKTWDTTYGELPKNHILMPRERGLQLPPEVDIDVIISGNKFDNFNNLKPIADRYRIPLISIEHTGPYPQWPAQMKAHLNSLKGDINVFITHWSRQAWGWNEGDCDVVYHGIQTETFAPLSEIEKKPYILSVCNEFSRPQRHLPCGYPLWKEVIKDLSWKHLGGGDPGFSEPAKDVNDLVKHYNECSMFINTSQISPVPNALLEAASCGAGIVTTSHCEVGNIFKHGETALISNNPKEMRAYCIELLNDSELRLKLGQNARKMIIGRFGLDTFVSKWNALLEKAVKIRK